MSAPGEAPQLKKYVIERNVDLSGKSREELAAATQARACERRANCEVCVARVTPPPPVGSCPRLLASPHP